MEVLPPFSSGTVTMLSGVMVSTGAAALFFLLLEAVSPVEAVIFFPQPVNEGTTMAQRTAKTMCGITHCGIAHLFLS
jgi:hypothetical protein